MAEARRPDSAADAALTALADGRRVALTPVLLRSLVDRLDAVVAVAPDPRDTAHDALFGALMARLDGLQQDRTAYLMLFRQLQGQPELLAAVLPRVGRSVATLLDQTGMGAAGWRQPAQVAALLGVYAQALHAWRRDDSRDLSATLRALDTGLRRALHAGAWLGLFTPVATGKR